MTKKLYVFANRGREFCCEVLLLLSGKTAVFVFPHAQDTTQSYVFHHHFNKEIATNFIATVFRTINPTE